MSQPTTHTQFPILPGATLGVMGGGQLGRMFIHAAQQMGYFTAVLDPAPDSPAGCVSHHHIRTSYTDQTGLSELANLCAAITTEFENVPALSLENLAQHTYIAPCAQAVAVAQNRAAEKALFMQSNVGCAPHAIINTVADLANINPNLFPAILKTVRLGYDGKGQTKVQHQQDLQAAWHDLGDVCCVLEKQMTLAYEISVLVARGHDGHCIHFPIQRNLHRDGILAVTEVALEEKGLPQTLQEQAFTAAKKLAQTLNYVGILCAEFFVLEDGSLIANEIAPRPHNSGHWTIDGCDYSQYQAQVRAMTGLALTPPHQHASAVMLNLLGDLWFDQANTPCLVAWDKILALPGTHLHLYGKTQAKKGRKMGHLTITAPTLQRAKTTALQAAQILGIKPW